MQNTTGAWVLEAPVMFCYSGTTVIFCFGSMIKKKKGPVSCRRGCPVEVVVNLPNLSNFPSRKELSHRAGKIVLPRPICKTAARCELSASVLKTKESCTICSRCYHLIWLGALVNQLPSLAYPAKCCMEFPLLLTGVWDPPFFLSFCGTLGASACLVICSEFRVHLLFKAASSIWYWQHLCSWLPDVVFCIWQYWKNVLSESHSWMHTK